MLNNLISLVLSVIVLLVYLMIGFYSTKNISIWMAYYAIVMAFCIFLGGLFSQLVNLRIVLFPLVIWGIFALALRIVSGKYDNVNGLMFNVGVASWHVIVFFICLHMAELISSWGKK